MKNVLKDQKLRHSALVEIFNDGSALRNDGVKLKPAASNPWYVLATVAGEHHLRQGSSVFDSKRRSLMDRNRRFWNGWMCRNIDATKLSHIASILKLPEAEIAPLSELELQQVKGRFRENFPEGLEQNCYPALGAWVDMSQTYFEADLDMSGFYFGATDSIYFSDCYFAGSADFYNSYFASGRAFFCGTYFSRSVSFRGAHFKGARFNNACFIGGARFEKSNFLHEAIFESSEFSGYANFNTALFRGQSNFANSFFKDKTDFRSARFEKFVPEFYNCETYQNTRFSADGTLWPSIVPDIAQEGKQAYIRLRQIATESQDLDLEHYFLRQEMRCKEVLANGLDWVAFVLYRFISDSGVSVARPALALLIMWFIPGFLYLFTYATQITQDDIDMSPLGPFGLSFANLFSFLGLNRLYFGEIIVGFGAWLTFVAGLQAVSGVILLFFLGLGLRNRFRLR